MLLSREHNAAMQLSRDASIIAEQRQDAYAGVEQWRDTDVIAEHRQDTEAVM
jgi:quinol monooxygenase YgiN